MNDEDLDKIFKEGSRTFYNSSIFFPKDVRRDVFVLYGFVRTFDNYVDSTPQNGDAFQKAKLDFYKYFTEGKNINQKILIEFSDLAKRKNFKKEWIDGFLESMESDLGGTICITLQDSIDYMYGSAEVIGLMMCSILGIPKEAYPSAKLLGRAFQYINFIRDIDEDIDLRRQYLPQEELEKVGLTEYNREYLKINENKFNKFMSNQVNFYKEWLEKGSKGYKYIPKRYLIPITTAAEMYNWTGEKIKSNPSIVFERKVKPSKLRILATVIKNSIL